jgi:hypothetical protein
VELRDVALFLDTWAGSRLVYISNPGYQPPTRASGLRVSCKQEEFGINSLQLHCSNENIHNRDFGVHAVSRTWSVACLCHWIACLCASCTVWTLIRLRSPGDNNLSAHGTWINARRSGLTSYIGTSATSRPRTSPSVPPTLPEPSGSCKSPPGPPNHHYITTTSTQTTSFTNAVT